MDAEQQPLEQRPIHRIWCTRCNSPHIQYSRRHNLLDFLLYPLGVRAFRCHACYGRFRRFIPWGRRVKTYNNLPSDEPQFKPKSQNGEEDKQ